MPVISRHSEEFYGRIRGAINGQIGVQRGEPHMSDNAEPAGSAEFDDKTRRDFLFTTTATVGAVGAAVAVWPLIDQMNPAADTLALRRTHGGGRRERLG